MAPSKTFQVYGIVRGENSGTGIPGLQVEVMDKDFHIDDRLGLAFTDEQGRFTLSYDAADFQDTFLDKKPDLYVRVRTAQGHLILTTENAVRYNGGSTEEFIIEIPDAPVRDSGSEVVQPLGQFQVIGEHGQPPIVSVQVVTPRDGPKGGGAFRLYDVNIGLCRPQRREPKQIDFVEEEHLDLEEVMQQFRAETIRPWKQPGTPMSLMPGPVGKHIPPPGGHHHNGEEEAPDEEKPTTVFTPDQRYYYYDLAYPWRAMGRIDIEGGGVCSGCIIGPRHVLTASHCIPWKAGGGAGWVKFTPHYYNGSGPWGSYWAHRVCFYRKNSGSLNHEEIAFDYVVLVFDDYLGNQLGWLGSKTYSASWDDEGSWSHVGYPGDLGLERPTFQSECAIDSTQVFGGGQALRNRCDLVGGHSGGPVFGWWGGLPYAIGVASTEAFDHNEYGGGVTLPSLINWARSNFS